LEFLKEQVLDSNTKAVTVTAICVVGLAGIGKTTLASQLVRQMQLENAPFSVAAWESLRSATREAPSFNWIIDSLLLTLSEGAIRPAVTVQDDYLRKTERLVKLLREQRCLIVLDNVETVLKIEQVEGVGYFADNCLEYAWLFKQLIETEHQSKVIFTSRERLAELPQRETYTLSLTGMEQELAIALLRTFNLIATQEELAQLADYYQGHPKALELVAAIICDDNEFQGKVERFLRNHQHWRLIRDIESLVDQIMIRLSKQEQSCLLRISIYQTQEYPLLYSGIAAQMPEVSQYELKEIVILALKRRHLLDYNPELESYELHPLIQEKTYSLLSQDPEAARNAHRRAYGYFFAIPLNPEHEWKNIEDIQPLLRAYYHACQAGDWDEAAKVVSKTYDYLNRWGYLELLIRIHSNLIPLDWKDGKQLVGSVHEYVDILWRLGLAYYDTGKCETANSYLQESLSLSRKIKDSEKEAISLCYLGLNHEAIGNYQLALENLQNCLAIATSIKNQQIEYKALEYLGLVYGALANFSLAVETFSQSLKIARKMGFAEGEAIACGNLGHIYNRQGEYQLAIEYIQQQLDISIRIESKKIKAYALANFSMVYSDLKNYRTAINYANELIEVAREIGDKHREAHAISTLGKAHREIGEYPTSLQLLSQHLQLIREIGHKRGEGDTLYHLGLTFRQLGQINQSLESLKNSRRIFHQIGCYADEASALVELAKSSLKTDAVSHKTIQEYLNQAEQICVTLQLPLLREIQTLKEAN
jgi:tetratricopeptide (TPR) repeat protein